MTADRSGRARGGSGRSIFFLVVLLALLVPDGAAAATVVNGDFESGTLGGWRTSRTTESANWFAYQGTDAPIGHKRAGAQPVQAPPQGAHAAITDEAIPDTLILYQDVTLEAGFNHRLSLLTYYDSYKPIAVPTPDTLSVAEEKPNQQYRIDVLKANAPIESLDPADILRTLFRTKPGDPVDLAPTRVTADLSPFAGQTVRLRIANAVHEDTFNAGVDAVSISSTKPGGASGRGGPRGSSRLSFGKVKANRKNGMVTLPVRVPGPGLLTAKGKKVRPPASVARESKARGLRSAIVPATVKIRRAGIVPIRLKPTPFALAILRQKHKLRVKLMVTYLPTGAPRETASLPVVFRLEAAPRH
jgi:hypothetical protein